MNIAGTGVTVSMGTLNVTGVSNGYTFTFDGSGNTIDLDGWKIGAAASPTQNVVHQIKGSANVTLGLIENGTAGFVNGAEFNSDGVTRLTGNNTYTGTTTYLNGTNIVSGNNSAAVGNVSIGGTSGSSKTPVVRLNNVNAISSASGISGSSSSATGGTMDFNAATAYTFNIYNGGNMIFTNSFGQASVVTFTNASSLLTSSAGSSGGRSLQNNSSNLKIVFDGSLDIGSSQTDTSDTMGGVGDFLVKGNIFSTTVGSVRGLNKTGTGLLEMRGANNSYNGDTQVLGGTLSVTNGALLTGSTVKLNAGTLNVNGTVGAVVQTNGTYNLRGTAGALTLSGGAATVFSGGTLGNTTVTNTGSLLVVNGTAGNVQVDNGGSLGGSGTVGAVTLASGSFLKPGNSPGLLTAASSTWAAGATYNWEINQAGNGTAGVNWDLFSVTGALDLSALSSTAQMNLVLNSLPSMDDYTTTDQYSWVFAQAGSLLGTGGTTLTAGANVTDLFNITAAGFNGGTGPANGWRVEVGSSGNSLNLMAVPEPSTGSLMVFGLSGLVLTRLLRRKIS
jgi:autotransporter-associated beta strand protein